MKILHVLGQRPEKTGSGIYLHAMMRKAQEQGLTVHMLAGVPAGPLPDLEDLAAGVCSHVFFESGELPFAVPGMSDVMPYKSSLFRDLKGGRLRAYQAAFGRALEKAVERFRPDVIHSNHLFVLSALVRKLFPQLPLVTTCHGTDLRQYHNCEHLRAFVKTYCRQIDRVIALTHDQKEAIAGTLGIPRGRIVVTGSGYDETRFNRVPKTLDGPVQILYAGKFNRSKGVPWLLKSLTRIADRDWHLHMAGGGQGPEYETCLGLAGRLGTRVTVHGFVDHQRLSELMQQAHLQVLPSFFEGLPLVLFEGLASGCRIITTRLSGFTEIFSQARRDTVRLIDLPKLATIDRPFEKDEVQLEKMLAGALEDMLAAVRRKPDFSDPAADRIARQYTWQRVFEKVLSVYRSAARKKK